MHCSLVDEASSFGGTFWFITRRSIHGISLRKLMQLGNDDHKGVDLRSLPPFPSDFFIDDLPEINLYPLVNGSKLFLFCGTRTKPPSLSSKIYQLSLVDNLLRISEASPHYIPPLPVTFRAPPFFARIEGEFYLYHYLSSMPSMSHEHIEEGFWVLDCTKQQWRALECPPHVGNKNLLPMSDNFVLRDKIFFSALDAREDKFHLYTFDTRTKKWDEADYKLMNTLLKVGTVVSLPPFETVVVSWDWSIRDAGRSRRRVTFCAGLLDCQDNSVLCSQSLDELRTPVLRCKPDPEVEIVDLGGEGLICALVRGMVDEYDDLGNVAVLCVFVFALSSRKEKKQGRFLNIDVRVNRVFKSPQLYEQEGLRLLDMLHYAFIVPSMQEESPYKIDDVDSGGDLVTKYELKIGSGISFILPSALPVPPPRPMVIRCKEDHAVIPSPSSLPATSVPNQNFKQALTHDIPVYDHTLQRWRTEPSIKIKGVGRWVRPQSSIAKCPEHEQESGSTHAGGRSMREEPDTTLTVAQRDEFENMLRTLTSDRRSQIKEVMGFSLDNADAAGEIVDVLTQSLTLKQTPIGNKFAKLMLVSAILHNSGAPGRNGRNASAYRTKFEATLPDIMESFNDLYQSIMGNIVVEALKEGVLRILQAWADCFVFSDAYVNGLRATFLRSENSGVIPFHSICGDASEIEQKISSEDTVVGGKTNKDLALAMGRGGAATKELMSLPLAELERRCRHNGLSLVGGREMMVARLLSLEEAEKQTGYELDDGLTEADTSISAHAESQMNEEQRRHLEAALVTKEEIEKKVAAYRKRLQSEYGLSDSGEDGQGNRSTSSERRDKHGVSRKRYHSRSPSQ